MFLTTLCYIEKDDCYLMLHRVKKENDLNHDKWIGVGGKFEAGEMPEECTVWEGDKIFLRLLDECEEYFSLKLVYEGDTLVDKKLIIAGKEQKAE